MPLFNQLTYFDRLDPLDAAVQMSLDELLLQEADGVMLRDYGWAEPSVSIGYFGFSSEALTISTSEPLRAFVRRPSGGGLVEHGHGRDFTYSIIVGAAEMRELDLAPRASYRAIHQILAETLRDFGVAADLAVPDATGDGGAACFRNPVDADLLVAGKKIAGAGQKRSRGAFLHQGSVQPVDLPPEFGEAFANRLGGTVQRRSISAELLDRAEALAEEKYRSDAWNLRR